MTVLSVQEKPVDNGWSNLMIHLRNKHNTALQALENETCRTRGTFKSPSQNGVLASTRNCLAAAKIPS